jgi:2,4-dienoyl-CoA reductase-like NADH-dependent reductase (Old Yellow Enzyme family)
MGTDVQKTLFTPLQVGPVTLKHRVVMPPMSRLRAQPGTGIRATCNSNIILSVPLTAGW